MRAPIAGAAACAAGFGGLMAFIFGVDRAASLDARLFEGLGTVATPARTPLLDVLAHTADPAPLIAFLALLAFLARRWGRQPQLLAAIGAVAAAALTTQMLKIGLAHPRVQPALGAGVGPVSFPSGHATAAMSMAIAAVIVVPRRLRPMTAVLGAAYAITISITVIGLGWHYPSDVLGGLLVATGFGFLAIAGLRASAPGGVDFERPRLQPTPLLQAVAAVAAATVVLLAVSRAGGLIEYARVHTSVIIVACGLAASCGAMLAALTSAVRE